MGLANDIKSGKYAKSKDNLYNAITQGDFDGYKQRRKEEDELRVYKLRQRQYENSRQDLLDEMWGDTGNSAIDFVRKQARENHQNDTLEELLDVKAKKIAEEQEDEKRKNGVFGAFADGYDVGDVTKTILKTGKGVVKGGVNAVVDSFNKSNAFSDGYQIGDITKTWLGTNFNLRKSAIKGGFQAAEGVSDWGYNRLADVADKIGFEEQADKWRKFSEEDTLGEISESTKRILSGDYNRSLSDEEVSQKYNKKFGWLDQNSILSDKGNQYAQEIARMTTTAMMGSYAGSAIGEAELAANTSKLGKAALKLLQKTGTYSSFYMGAESQSENEARKLGATPEEAHAYGVLSGTIEIFTEEMFGGLGAISSKLGLGEGALDGSISKLTSKIKSGILRNVVETGILATGEGIEELTSGILGAYAQKLTYMNDADISELLNSEDLMQQFVDGMITSAIMQTPTSINAARNGRSVITEKTQNEEKVIDNVVNQRFNQENNTKTKAEIRKEVTEQFDKTSLSSEELANATKDMNVTDNDYYIKKNIQDSSTRFTATEDDLKVTTDKKGNEINRINKNVSSETMARYNQELADSFAKSHFNNTTAAHEDFVKLKTFQEATGIGVELVDYDSLVDQGMLTKDSDGRYYFNENGKMTDKEAFINGFSKDGKVYLNRQGSKKMETTFGHEIAEVIKATDSESYKQLRNLAVEVGKADGTLSKKTMKQYQNDYGKLGQYTDSYLDEYVNDKMGELFDNNENLFNAIASEPNVFHRAIDELKFLYKSYKAQTAEQKMLLNAQRNLEKAYKQVTQNVANDIAPVKSSTKYELKNYENDSLSNLDYDIDEILNNKKYKNVEDNEKIDLGNYYSKDTQSKINKMWANGVFDVTDSQIKEINELTKANMEDISYNEKYKNLKPSDIKVISTEDAMNYFNGGGERNLNEFSRNVEKIKNNGIIEPIEISIETGKVIDGNHRLFAAQQLGIEEVPIVVVGDASLSNDNLLKNILENGESYVERSSKTSRLANGNESNKGRNSQSNESNEYSRENTNSNELSGEVQRVSKSTLDNTGSRENSQAVKNTAFSLGENDNDKINEIKNQRKVLREEVSELREERKKIIETIPNYSTFKKYDELTDIDSMIDEKIEQSKELYSELEKLEKQQEEKAKKEKEDRLQKEIKEASPFKLEQYKTVTTANPMNDEYHTGIRSPKDIRTWQEAMNVAEEEGCYSWGDFNEKDAQKALKENEITIYSSYPIKDGVFVSSSYNQAQMYAGSGKVYQKTVPLNNVAWINADEGQFASPKTKFSLGTKDNKGRTLSVQQQEYFKDSKIVDENNQLIELYHRTPAGGFTVFNGAKGINFFTNDPNADYYGKEQYKVYLDIKNPLVIDGNGNAWNDIEYNQKGVKQYTRATINDIIDNIDVATKEDIVDLAQAIDKDNTLEEYLDYFNTPMEALESVIEAYDEGATIEQFKEDYGTLSAFVKNDAIPSRTITTTNDITNWAKENGYDGVIFKNIWDKTNGAADVYATLDSPNQIKNVDNTNPTDNNDIRFSLGNRDSQGRTLTKEQSEFFKDSKVVDENGNLKVMYHGTPDGNFTIFRPGSYFSADKDYASGYENTWASSLASTGKKGEAPKTYEVYLNITKPFTLKDSEAKSIYINEYIKGGNSAYFDPYTDYSDTINNMEEIDWVEGEDLKEWLIENHPEFDGLYLDEGGDGGYGEAEYRWRGISAVPFNSNQIKNIDNLNPTNNDDINYSLAPIGNSYQKSNVFNDIEQTSIAGADLVPVREQPISNTKLDYLPIEPTRAEAYDNTPNEAPTTSSTEWKQVDGKTMHTRQDEIRLDQVNSMVNRLQERVDSLDSQISEIDTQIEQNENAKKQNPLDEWYYDDLNNDLYEKSSKLLNQYESQFAKLQKLKDEQDTLSNKVNNTALKLKQKDIRRQLVDSMGITESDLNTGKHINQLNLSRTDAKRVAEKIFDGEVAKKINAATVDRVKHNTAEQTRFLNKERNDIKNLGIKARSNESALVQKFGEKIITEQELRNQVDSATANKIINAANVIRGKYDSYIDQINEKIVSMGYDAIPKRQDYMRHFQELSDKFSEWGIPFNRGDMAAEDLPTDINGRTDDFKPGKNWFASALRRTGEATTYDAITGIDGYLDGASNLIYHTEDIQRYRALSDYIRELYGQEALKDTEYMGEKEFDQKLSLIQGNHLSQYAAWLDEQANAIANKKSRLDRGFEQYAGRRAYTLMNTLKTQVGSNMTGFNLSSALTNFISTTIAAGKTSKSAMLKGTVSTISNMFNNDGFINKSDFLTSRFGSDRLSSKLWQKMSNAGQLFMRASDYFTSNLIVRSKYFEGISKGMSETEAIQYADDFGARVLGDRSKGATANIFNSKTLGLFTQFQLETNNQLDYLFHDSKMEYKDFQGTKQQAMAKVTWQTGQIFAYSYIFNEMFQALVGRRPAFDPIEILKTLFGIGDDDDEEIEERIRKAKDMLIDSLPFTSIANGRIPMQEIFDIIPDAQGALLGGQTDKYGNEMSKEQSRKNLMEDMLYFLPTGGGQIRKTYQGAKQYVLPEIDSKNYPVAGSYTDKGNLRFEADESPWGMTQSLLFGQWASQNAQDYIDGGFKTTRSTDVTKMGEYGMNTSQYKKFKNGLKEFTKVKNDSGEYKYYDAYGNIYYVNKEKNIVYDENHNRTYKDTKNLTKATKKDLTTIYVNSMNISDSKKEKILRNELGE